MVADKKLFAEISVRLASQLSTKHKVTQRKLGQSQFSLDINFII